MQAIPVIKTKLKNKTMNIHLNHWIFLEHKYNLIINIQILWSAQEDHYYKNIVGQSIGADKRNWFLSNWLNSILKQVTKETTEYHWVSIPAVWFCAAIARCHWQIAVVWLPPLLLLSTSPSEQPSLLTFQISPIPDFLFCPVILSYLWNKYDEWSLYQN